MEMVRGQVVRSKAGHDEGDFLTVLAVELPYLLLCDGKRRSMEHPKRKKKIHVSPTRTVLQEDQLRTNRQIRIALRQYRDSETKNSTEQSSEPMNPES